MSVKIMTWMQSLTLLALLLAQGQCDEKCQLTQSEVKTLFSPLLQEDWNLTFTYQIQLSPNCLAFLNTLRTDVLHLAKAKRIVDPDEEVDNQILHERFENLQKSFESLKSNSDTATEAILGSYELNLKNIKQEFLDYKSTPEMKLLRLIYLGEGDHVGNITKHEEKPVEFLERIIQAGFDPHNTTFLKQLIFYSTDMSYELDLAGLSLIYKKMQQRHLENSPEILIIVFFLEHLDTSQEEFTNQKDFVKEQLKTLSAQVQAFKERLLNDLATDAVANKFKKLKQVASIIPYQVLNEYLPELVERLSTPDIIPNVATVLQIIKNLPYLDSDCVTAESLYFHLSRLNQHETFEAFNLWLYVRYVINEDKNFAEVDEDNQAKCVYVEKGLRNTKDKHLARYVSLLELKEWETLQFWLKTYDISLRWILPDVVEKVDDVGLLLSLMDNLPNIEEVCITLHAMSKKFENVNKEVILQHAVLKLLKTGVFSC